MFISFAQQFEDVLLWRALKHVEQGFYIDIGAQHPEIDSVSKAFYDHNWRGVHVEPVRHYANLIREQRPDEIVLEVAVAEHSGIITFYDIPDTGLSTADASIAEGHRHQGFAVQETTVPCVPLADLFNHYGDRDIHWLKIDVEGLELAVLKGWGDSPVRPWIVVVESTLPNTQTDTHDVWEPELLKRGYIPALFDSLNRYYVSESHLELRDAFRYGPSLFDNFAFNTTVGSYCTLFEEKFAKEHARAQQCEHNWNVATLELQDLRTRFAQQEQQSNQARQKLRKAQEATLQLEKQVAALKIQLDQRERAFNRVNERVHQLQGKWSTAKEKIDRFRRKANEFERESNRLSQELASVYASKSWKFGAPLRISQRVIKKIFRLLKGTPAALPPAQSNIETAFQAGQLTPSVNDQTNQPTHPKPGNADLTQVAPATRQVYQQLIKARSHTNQDSH